METLFKRLTKNTKKICTSLVTITEDIEKLPIESLNRRTMLHMNLQVVSELSEIKLAELKKALEKDIVFTEGVIDSLINRLQVIKVRMTDDTKFSIGKVQEKIEKVRKIQDMVDKHIEDNKGNETK